MSPRYDDEWIAAMLDREGRFGRVRPEDLLVDTGLRESQIVVDVGCGPGLLTLAAASVVGPAGKVYAVDTEQKMLDLVDSRAKDAGLENVAPVANHGQRVPLPDESVDYAICSLVLHYPDAFDDRVDMARELARMLRLKGRLLVIEWVPQEGDDPASRLAQDDAEKILRQAHLHVGKPLRLGERQYAIVATRPGDD